MAVGVSLADSKAITPALGRLSSRRKPAPLSMQALEVKDAAMRSGRTTPPCFQELDCPPTAQPNSPDRVFGSTLAATAADCAVFAGFTGS